MEILGINVNYKCEKSKKNVIYIIHFIGTDKKYIGQTTLTLHERTYGHIYDAIKTNTNDIISKAIRKYKSIEVNILCECENIDELNEKEAYFIKHLNTLLPNGYNQKEGGCNSKASDELRAKFSSSMKERYKDEKALEQRRQKQSEVTKKLWQREDYAEKISNAAKKNWQRENYREVVSTKLIEARRKCCNKVYQYDLDLNLIAIYNTGPEAALANGLKYDQSKNIVYCAKQNETSKALRKCYGYIWTYREL